MSIKYEKYYTTSEFAKLCNVTKHTLFHYDDIDLLKPEIVNEKGYRYYCMNQFFVFDIITILKEARTPLKEIKKYIEHQDTGFFLAILEEKKKYLANEQIKLQRMQRFLQNTVDMINHGLNTTYGQPRIEECEEEYLAAVKLPRQTNEKKCLSKVSELYKYCMKHYQINALPTGIIVSKNSLENGLSELFDKADYYCCKIDYKCDSEWLYIKPKGKYAVIDHKGTYESIPDSYEILKDYITKEHLIITGNAYEFELLGCVAVDSPEKNVLQIAIQVQ